MIAMARSPELSSLRDEINTIIRRNSDRGAIDYSDCNRLCSELFGILERANHHPDPRKAFDVYILVLLKMMKLISYADTSSGAAGDVVRFCQEGIETLCRNADESNNDYFFKTIIKTVRNKVFQGWSEDGFEVLKSAVHFVRDKKQAQKIFDIFLVLGNSYDGKPYSDQFLITHAVIERLDGPVKAERYLYEHIDVPEVRMVAVERAIDSQRYSQAE